MKADLKDLQIKKILADMLDFLDEALGKDLF